jgi:hypothetical protein
VKAYGISTTVREIAVNRQGFALFTICIGVLCIWARQVEKVCVILEERKKS